MKKITIGLIVGFLLAISTTTIADGIIGKVVESTMPLFVDGERIETNLIIVEGISYAPMRDISDRFGYSINYNSEKKEVSMIKIKKDNLFSTPDINNKTIVKKEFDFKNATNIIPNHIEARNPLKPNLTTTRYLFYDNEFCLPFSSIGLDEFNREGSNVIVSLNGKTVTGTMESRFENGDQMGFYNGYEYYVKLSALGLKGTIKDGILIIEEASN